MAAHQALAACDSVVDRLHKMCCEPDRSPRMLAIKDSIASIQAELNAAEGEPASLERALSHLMDVGGQIGWLQIGCCAEARMPLYAEALERLTAVQLNINETIGNAH